MEGNIMNLIIGMKEIKTPLKHVGLRIFKAYDGNIFVKFGKRPRKMIFGQRQPNRKSQGSQAQISRKIAN